MIKKWLPFALLSASLTPFCHANNSLPIYVPNTELSNEMSVGAVLLRPGGSNDYGVLVNPFNPYVATPILSPNWQPEGLEPGFGAGFTLNFRHAFTHSGNDINLYWLHLRTSDKEARNANTNPPPAQQMVGPFWNIGPDAGPTTVMSGQLRTNYDVLIGELGKRVNIGHDLSTRLFTGLGVLWLHQKTSASFSGIDPILGPYIFSETNKSKFNAGGFRFGIDGEYNAWQSLKFVGLLAGNLFIGSQQPRTDTSGSGSILTAGGIPVNYQSITHNSFIQVVPSFDAKLGLKYSYQYDEDKTLSIEGGYMTSIYLNVIQNYVPSTYVPASLGIVSGSVYLQSLMKTTESFSVDGPYVTFSFKM